MLGLLSIVSFDFLALDCWNTGPNDHYFVVYVWSSLPILLALVIIVAGVLRLILGCLNHEDEFLYKKNKAKVLDQHIWLLLFLSYIVLPPVSNKQLQSFDCIKLESGERYLRVNTSINCRSEEHATFSFYNLIFLVVYQFIPILWVLVLYRRRKELNPSNSSGVVDEKDDHLALYIRDRNPHLSPLKFLFVDYKCSKWWFEVVDMYRRITFIGVLPLVSADAAIRSSFGMILAILSVAYFREEQPYRVEFTNVVSHIAQVCIYVCIHIYVCLCVFVIAV
jgi:hypothetical protein